MVNELKIVINARYERSVVTLAEVDVVRIDRFCPVTRLVSPGEPAPISTCSVKVKVGVKIKGRVNTHYFEMG